MIRPPRGPDCRTSRRDPEASPARGGDRIAHHETLRRRSSPQPDAVETNRPADRARVIAWPLKRWHWRGVADMQATSRILTTGRSRWVGKPRIPALFSRRPAPGHRVASGWPNDSWPGVKPIRPNQAAPSSRSRRRGPPGRSVAARIPHRTRLVKPPEGDSQTAARTTALASSQLLGTARTRQRIGAPRLRALFWNRCWEPALVVSRTASVSSIARR